MDPNWTRWIHSTIATIFTKNMKTVGVTLYIEPQDREITEAIVDHAELRWTGPFAKQVPKCHWLFDITINLLVTSILSRKDVYQHKKVVGLVQSIMPDSFPVMRYGSTPNVDTQDVLGCFQLRREDAQGITTTYFGRIDTDVSLEQSTVQGEYQMLLKGKSQ
jgi:hypothetical protein